MPKRINSCAHCRPLESSPCTGWRSSRAAKRVHTISSRDQSVGSSTERWVSAAAAAAAAVTMRVLTRLGRGLACGIGLVCAAAKNAG